MDLGLDSEDLNKCVQCGLCLPHCPTYRVTGDETMSPRGRIKLMREVHDNAAPVTAEVVDAFETCVQCRGCEPACPSGVPYGRLIESTRETLVDAGHSAPTWLKAGYRLLDHPRLLRAGGAVAAIAQRTGMVPDRVGLPADLQMRPEPLRASGQDVWMFTGCVMDVVQRQVHRDTQTVLEAAGFGVAPTGDTAPCCGALSAHAGLGDQARRQAASVIDALSGDDCPIVVNSAGCGAAMKDYGHLLATPSAAAFSARVVDACEFIAGHVDRLSADGPVEPLALRVAIQDPCHLRHVQRVHDATRTALEPFVAELVELADDGLCCGAGGAYSMMQPDLAGQIRDRKVAAIGAVGPDVVASANPGCSMHLAQAGLEMVHPMTLLARALDNRS